MTDSQLRQVDSSDAQWLESIPFPTSLRWMPFHRTANPQALSAAMGQGVSHQWVGFAGDVACLIQITGIDVLANCCDLSIQLSKTTLSIEKLIFALNEVEHFIKSHYPIELMELRILSSWLPHFKPLTDIWAHRHYTLREYELQEGVYNDLVIFLRVLD